MNGHVKNQLSAYLDGEARNPEAVRRHLRVCPECSRELEALREVSGAFQALEQPEDNPAFVTRVMACVRGEPVPAARWRIGWRPVCAMAASALLITGAWLAAERMAPPEQPAEQLSAVEWITQEFPAPPQELTAPEFRAAASGGALDAAQLEPLDTTAWIMALSEDPWFVEMAAAYEAETSWDEELETLSEEELDNFYILLAGYMAGD